MDKILEKYLDTVDRHLRPLPASERVDIVKEIKGSMMEMQSEGISAENIAQKLGDPRELAKAYLGDLLSNGTGFSWKRFLTVCAFYSMVGISGLFVIPVLAIVAPVFLICAVLMPVVGALKLIDFLLGLGIPYMQYINVQFGNTVLSPVPVFFASIVTGVILYLAGRGAWKLLISYCKNVRKTKKDLSV